jgi:hypothetical protein
MHHRFEPRPYWRDERGHDQDRDEWRGGQERAQRYSSADEDRSERTYRGDFDADFYGRGTSSERDRYRYGHEFRGAGVGRNSGGEYARSSAGYRWGSDRDRDRDYGEGYGAGRYGDGSRSRNEQRYGAASGDDYRSSSAGRESDWGWSSGGRAGGSDFGRTDFRAEESSPYYGTGNYSSGGSGFGGGYRGMQGMGAYGPSGGSYNAEYGHAAEGSYGWGRNDERAFRDRDWRDSNRERHRGFFDRLFGRGPKGYKRSDERLREDISERLMYSTYLDSSDVSVEVADGVVTLEGTVPERSMRHAIEDVADSCPGVRDVDNKIRVQRNSPARNDWNAGTQASSSSLSATSASGGSTGVAGTTTGSPTATGRTKTN